MARKLQEVWKSILKEPPPPPLSSEERRAMVERLARLDQFRGELTYSDRDDPSSEVPELADRYSSGEPSPAH